MCTYSGIVVSLACSPSCGFLGGSDKGQDNISCVGMYVEGGVCNVTREL